MQRRQNKSHNLEIKREKYLTVVCISLGVLHSLQTWKNYYAGLLGYTAVTNSQVSEA